jgi:hypothetical protein
MYGRECGHIYKIPTPSAKIQPHEFTWISAATGAFIGSFLKTSSMTVLSRCCRSR